MRETHTIEREIDSAREDLQASLGELKDVVHDKLDVRKQLRDRVQRGKAEARQLVVRTKRGVEENPATALMIALGLIGITIALIAVSRRNCRLHA